MSAPAPHTRHAEGPNPNRDTDESPLDDLMLAMDVVDTLRRRERLVARELDDADRAQDLKQRLKRIYAQQGIEVPDPVIERGVAALREGRFRYRPPAAGYARTLALLYATRKRWGRWVGRGLAVAVLAWVGHYALYVAPDRRLPSALDEAHARAAELAAGDQARSKAQLLLAAGRSALDQGRPNEARTALAALDRLRATLALAYDIRIVDRPGERSGIWRVPDINRDTRHYYLIVEGVDANGERVTVAIDDEDTGRTEEVAVWAVRVDPATFMAVRQDRQDNGIIDDARLGFKVRGRLAPTYLMPVCGGTITRW